MKSFINTIATIVVIIAATFSANAQVSNDGARFKNSDQNWKMLYGNRCFLGEAIAIYDITDGKVGGGVSASFFRKGNFVGVEGYYMKDRTSIHAFYKRDFVRNPRSKFNVQAEAFFGIGEQLMGSATKAEIKGDGVSGNLNSYLATYKMRPQAGVGVNFEIRVAKKFSINAGVRGMYRFNEGSIVDAAGKVDIKGAEAVISNGTIPLDKHKFALQAKVGFQWRF